MSDADIKVVRIPRDTKARREGYLAGRHGLTADANPYDGDSRAARDWLMGLLDGRTRQLTVATDDLYESATRSSQCSWARASWHMTQR